MAQNERGTRQPEEEAQRPPLPLLRVCLLFAGLVLGFNLIHWTLLKPSHLEPLLMATARATAALIGTTGIGVSLAGTHLYMGNVHWEIILECTAFSAAIVYVSFVLAYPSSLSAKLLGVAAGLPFLFAANVIRLLALAWVVELWPGAAGFFHDYVWQVFFLLLVVLMWLLWIELLVRPKGSNPS